MEEKRKYTEADIRSLDAVTHVRMRPNLYFEKVYAEKSLDRLPLEVACHAFDEILDNNCSYIKITVYSDYFSMEYDAGMSLERRHPNDPKTYAESIMTDLYACRNYKKHLAVGDEFCELGILTINAASEWCELQTFADHKKGAFLFKEGRIHTRTIVDTEETKAYTKITVKPDPIIFPKLSINPTTLQKKIDTIRTKLNGVDIQLQVM